MFYVVDLFLLFSAGVYLYRNRKTNSKLAIVLYGSGFLVVSLAHAYILKISLKHLDDFINHRGYSVVTFNYVTYLTAVFLYLAVMFICGTLLLTKTCHSKVYKRNLCIGAFGIYGISVILYLLTTNFSQLLYIDLISPVFSLDILLFLLLLNILVQDSFKKNWVFAINCIGAVFSMISFATSLIALLDYHISSDVTYMVVRVASCLAPIPIIIYNTVKFLATKTQEKQMLVEGTV